MSKPLSKDSAAVALFWRNYQNLLKKSGVEPQAINWYVRDAKTYLEASSGRKLVTHDARDIETWLGELGRIGRMQAWQFVQVVDAVRYLFVMIRSPVVEAVDWHF